MSTAPSQVGWMPSLLFRPGLPQKVCQLSMKLMSFAGHPPPRQPVVEWRPASKHIVTGQIRHLYWTSVDVTWLWFAPRCTGLVSVLWALEFVSVLFLACILLGELSLGDKVGYFFKDEQGGKRAASFSSAWCIFSTVALKAPGHSQH